MIGHRSENLAGEAEEEIRAYFHTANNKNVENSSCFIFANDSSESSIKGTRESCCSATIQQLLLSQPKCMTTILSISSQSWRAD